MKQLLFSIAWILCGSGPLALAQDTITIPKSRLEELERKEAELEKLKGLSPKSQVAIPNLKTNQQDQAVPQTSPAHTAVTSSRPPGSQPQLPAALPPLENGALVSATDLAAHYRANAATADQRYRKRTFKVQGEIVGFEKPLLVRNYVILLKTTEPQTRIICDFYPSENFKAVFTANNGMELVGLLPDSRVPLAKVGDNVIIEGRCKGLSNGGVKLTRCEFKPAK